MSASERGGVGAGPWWFSRPDPGFRDQTAGFRDQGTGFGRAAANPEHRFLNKTDDLRLEFNIFSYRGKMKSGKLLEFGVLRWGRTLVSARTRL